MSQQPARETPLTTSQLNAFIQLEGEAIGTSFAANESTRAAFATDVAGGEWMIYVDSETKQEHWDLVRGLHSSRLPRASDFAFCNPSSPDAD
jgi:ABC-type thiamine transport system substrate-binding protein